MCRFLLQRVRHYAMMEEKPSPFMVSYFVEISNPPQQIGYDLTKKATSDNQPRVHCKLFSKAHADKEGLLCICQLRH